MLFATGILNKAKQPTGYEEFTKFGITRLWGKLWNVFQNFCKKYLCPDLWHQGWGGVSSRWHLALDTGYNKFRLSASNWAEEIEILFENKIQHLYSKISNILLSQYFFISQYFIDCEVWENFWVISLLNKSNPIYLFLKILYSELK